MLILVAAALTTSSCHNGSGVPAPSADSAFQKLSQVYLKGWMDWRPQSAVALGFHMYDTMVTDYSKLSIEVEVNRLVNIDSIMSALDTTALNAQDWYDYRILKSEIENELWAFRDVRYYYTNPMTYAGAVDVNTYIKRNFAPLESRVHSLIAVEKRIPEIYMDAKANLDDSLAKPLIDMAIEVAEGNASFMKGDVMVALKDLKDPVLLGAFKQSNEAAVAATEDFVKFLKTEKLPKANNKYAIGEANYRKMLVNMEMINLSPDSVLAIGMTELKREQDMFNHSAHFINPAKAPIDVYRDLEKEHPTADSLIPTARKHLETIRQYLIDHKICSMPSEVRIQVKETPPYARATTTASCDVPGPYETKANEAYYYVTPVDPKWTPQQQEDWLSTFNYYTTDVVTIHEAYPGHYTQFLHLNASKATDLEKIFSSYAYVEGWAHYTEKMMLDEGYGNNGDSVTAAKYRMAQSGDALLRICRLCCSIQLHCKGISVDSATHFFMKNWYQGDKPSRQEALRGTFDPGYLFYTVGKLEILKLRADYQKQEGANYSLKAFNDAMMDNGMPPIRLLRERLLKDKSLWGDVL